MKNEEEFKREFAAAFMAAWTANNYNRYCFEGRADKLADDMPAEDAVHLANAAWTNYVAAQ